MSNIDFEIGAVCYGDGRQWFVNTGSESDKFELANNDGSRKYSLYGILNFPKDLQLNEIKVGDYLHKSELDTEQKYNDIVEVFGLFGFNGFMTVNDYSAAMGDVFKLIYIKDTRFMMCNKHENLKRQLTYNQVIAIGKLKRMMLSKIGAESINSRPPKNLDDDDYDIANAAIEALKKANQCKVKSAVDYLTECVEVQKQRGEQYDSTGTGERSFDAAAKAYNALTGGNLKGSDVCLLLTCVKAVRQYSNHERLHEDSLLDLVSYASLWAEELNKELK